jgi:DNA-binding MarR family transcriptional regulator
MQVLRFSMATSKNIKRREVLSKLLDLGRKISTQTVFLHQAIAQSVGLNATDTKCLDLILSSTELVTAGWLSEMSGLTTGAITHILDRLENRHFIERVRDKVDRRKVLIRIRHESLEPLIPKYDEIGKAYVTLAKRYDDGELEVICDYMERASDIAQRELGKIVSLNRLGSAG